MVTVPERVAFLVLGLLLAGWLYWLTFRVQKLVTSAEKTLEWADRSVALALLLLSYAAAPQPVRLVEAPAERTFTAPQWAIRPAADTARVDADLSRFTFDPDGRRHAAELAEAETEVIEQPVSTGDGDGS